MNFQMSKMSKTKCLHYINFCIGLYFKDNLMRNNRLTPFFSASFDESLNKITQSEQMDMQIRLWKDGLVCTRYFDSQFMLQGNKENICDAILKRTQEFDQSKMNHLSMDGPNTNWAVLNLLQAKRSVAKFPELANIGSILCGCLKTAFEKSTWALGKKMKGNVEVSRR